MGHRTLVVGLVSYYITLQSMTNHKFKKRIGHEIYEDYFEPEHINDLNRETCHVHWWGCSV